MTDAGDYHQRLKSQFLALGLSERAAEIAADGRDGSLSSQVVSEAGRSSFKPQTGDALKLVARLEEVAADLCRRGVEEDKALREAAYTAVSATPDEATADWVAAVIGRRWPALYGGGSPWVTAPRSGPRKRD